MATKTKTKEWSDSVAALAVDALLHAEVVQKGQYERAVGIVSEEIYVRLCLGDYPTKLEEP